LTNKNTVYHHKKPNSDIRSKFLFTEIDDIRVNYISEKTHNDGRPDILLLHGWGANIDLFSQIIAHLAPYFNVYALDLPGFGKSGEPATPWCVNNYTDFVIKFCAKMGIKRCALIGHSFGGRIIIKMMSRENLPFTVDKIVLTGSAGIRPRQSLRQKTQTKCYKIIRNLLMLHACKKMMPNALEYLRKKSGSADYNAASPIMRQCLVRVVNEDLTNLLHNINVPILLVWGDKDTATPIGDGQIMAKQIPDAGLVVFKGCGHYAFLEQVWRFCRILDSFFCVQRLPEYTMPRFDHDKTR